jgi:enterochelin esterase family protein
MNMNTLVTLLLAFTCVAGGVWQGRSATDSTPAPSNLPGAEYPRIGSDLTVTFRFRAPEAKVVKLEGGAGLVKEPAELARGAEGVWTLTTAPAVPGFHYYWFNVDGVRVNDASSHAYFGYGRECSGIDIPEPGADYYAARPEIPHGEVRSHWYYSKLTGRWRRAHVYTPPGYDTTRTRYPVLYLQHGAGENERGWIEQGRANLILDNLIAAKQARPMLLVIDTGYAAYATNATGTFATAGSTNMSNRTASATAAFEEVMLKEIIPMIDVTYRTKPDRLHRAMAGLSMGSMQTLNLTLRHLEQFAWIGGMSGPPRTGFEVATAYDGVFRDAAAFNKKVRLLWLGAGTAEARFHASTVNVHESLERAGIKNVFYSSAGTDHEWQTWRRSLHDFAPRLF